MQISTNNKEGGSLKNPIVIDAPDTITGVTMEHQYLDQLIESLNVGVESIEQNLVLENGKQFDKIILTLEGGGEKVLFFDVSSFFGRL